jgi:general stress protein 26
LEIVMRVASFAEIEFQFLARVNRMVWCTLATVDALGRPGSRVVHTIWDGQTGWAMTRSGTPKLNSLTANPHVSLAYTSELMYPVYVDCVARWEDDPASRRYVWDLFLAAPPPLGYDPASMFVGVDDPGFGVLRFTPYRISLENVSGQGERRLVWRAESQIAVAV